MHPLLGQSIVQSIPIYTTNIDRQAPIACLSHRVNCPAFNTASIISAHLTYGL